MRPVTMFVVLLTWVASSARATILTVNTTTDGHDKTPGNGVCETETGNGVCTLRAAVEETSALGGTNTINVPAGTYVLTVTATCDFDTQVALCVTGTPTLTLAGAGAATTIIDGNATSNPPNGFGRVLDIPTGATVTVSGVTITDGASQAPFPGGMGGAVRNAGTLTLMDSVVSNSSGGFGGGIYNNSSLTLVRTVVSGNTALTSYGEGGGITNDGGTLTLTESAIRGNHARSNGGGIFNFNETTIGTITTDGSEISGNLSDSTGGGLEGNNYTVATLTNTTVSGNMAGSTGGGIILYDFATVNLNNVTITGNVAAISNMSGSGGGLSSGATVNIKNTIIAGNTDMSGFAPDCSALITSPLTSLGYNLIGNITNCDGVGSTSHDITGMDPHLGPLALNDNAIGPTQTHALLAGSPAIDAGNPATPGSGGNACESTDQRGVARVQPGDSLCDIGAYEAVPRPTTTTTTSSTTTTTSTSTTSSSTTTTLATVTTTSSTTTTTRLTTSTTRPSTTTSSSTTTMTTRTSTTTATRPPPTTTTTIPPSCPVAPTFDSIDCRLNALIAQVTAAGDIGRVRGLLLKQLNNARVRKEQADMLMAEGKAGKGRAALRHGIRWMIEFDSRVGSLTGRRQIGKATRQMIAAEGNAILEDMHTLLHA
jgi:CSLREA domain-containing protein